MTTEDDGLDQLLNRLGLPLLDPQERTAVLDLTRVVAHGTERRFGPLTAFALGLALGSETPAGQRAERVHQVIQHIQADLNDGLAGDAPSDDQPTGDLE